MYILAFSRVVREAFAFEFVLNLVWDSRWLRFPAFVLAFWTAFLEVLVQTDSPVFVCEIYVLAVSDVKLANRNSLPIGIIRFIVCKEIRANAETNCCFCGSAPRRDALGALPCA